MGVSQAAEDDDSRRWNHNVQLAKVVVDAVPPGAEHALDVGCGEGILCRRLRPLVPWVTGIDPDGASIDEARRRGGDGIDYLVGDFLTHPFEPETFDLVACVAALHQMAPEPTLTRMREVLRPGGRLAIVGLARSEVPRDLPWDAAGFILTRLHRIRKGWWDTPAPKTWPPPHTYREIRALTGDLLPGRRYRRHPLWRYTVEWTKPGG